MIFKLLGKVTLAKWSVADSAQKRSPNKQHAVLSTKRQKGALS
jgi:hypothetical protein